jgi:DNA-binding response OmpR family regulator
MSDKITIIDEMGATVADPGMSKASKRSNTPQFLSTTYDDQGLVIDKVAYVVHFQGEVISFPKKEFELLLLLASKPQKVFKREEILLSIWGQDHKPQDSRSLDVHIRMLRKKLSNRFITTVRGVGYKLVKHT